MKYFSTSSAVSSLRAVSEMASKASSRPACRYARAQSNHVLSGAASDTSISRSCSTFSGSWEMSTATTSVDSSTTGTYSLSILAAGRQQIETTAPQAAAWPNSSREP